MVVGHRHTGVFGGGGVGGSGKEERERERERNSQQDCLMFVVLETQQQFTKLY